MQSQSPEVQFDIGWLIITAGQFVQHKVGYPFHWDLYTEPVYP